MTRLEKATAVGTLLKIAVDIYIALADRHKKQRTLEDRIAALEASLPK